MPDHSARFVCAAFACLLLGSFSATEGLASDRPNILFILADDVGREVLGCYGGTSYPTPHLNTLASAGARLDHFYVMPVCHPTRFTLLTGTYPRHAGSPKWGSFPKQLEEQTFASIARNRGYETAVAGKWQLGLLKNDLMQPSRMGFDDWCLFGWHEGPRYHDPLIYQNGVKRLDTDGKFGPDMYVDFLVEFMQRCRATSKPFLAFYSMALCHDVTNDLDRAVPHGPNGRYLRYAEMVEQMDAQVGKLMRFLESSGLEEKTIIFFLADNGTPARSKVASRNGRNEFVYEEVSSRMHGLSVPGGKGKLTDWGRSEFCEPCARGWCWDSSLGVCGI
jgi:arylsulfatase A